MRWISSKILNWLTESDEPKQQFLCDFDRIKQEIRPCDVLLIEGNNIVSKVIQQITMSSWSHACLYLGRPCEMVDQEMKKHLLSFEGIQEDTQVLIEGFLGKGTILTPLESYKKYHVRICRPRGLLRSDAQKVMKSAISQLGYAYDVLQIFDLARFMMPWAVLPRKWRSSLFNYHAGDQTKTVCSTMIVRAFDQIKFPILPLIKIDNAGTIQYFQRNPKLYTPRDFDYSPYFEVIKFPYVAHYDYYSYKDLPWNQQGIVMNDFELFQGVQASMNVLTELPSSKQNLWKQLKGWRLWGDTSYKPSSEDDSKNS